MEIFIVSVWKILFLLQLSLGIGNSFSEKPELVFVKGGVFNMGCTEEQGTECDPDENPVQPVELDSYSIGKFEVTVQQYRAFCRETKKLMPDPPVWRWHDNHPVTGVNYFEAIEYCGWLSSKYGGQWRLPTEAEWEFAARGGTQSKRFIYSGSNNWDEVAWNKDNSGGQAMPVGSKMPNELGIYDMSGNLWEWCSDWYDSKYYSETKIRNPSGPAAGEEKVVRGGSWYYRIGRGRVSDRDSRVPGKSSIHTGFRVVFVENQKK